MAPSPALFKVFRKADPGWWERYEAGFRALMAERTVEKTISRSLFDVPTALLFSCETSDHCHRRHVLEYLMAKWSGLTVRQL